MGLDIVLESENHFQAVPRPKTVHQPPHGRAKVDGKDIKEILKSRYNILRRLDGDHRELSFSNSTTPRRKSMPARPHSTNLSNSEVVKRGSVYQSSKEVRSMRKLRGGRRNVEQAFDDEGFLSFEIVDPLPPPCSNESIGRSNITSLNAEPTTSSIDKNPSVPVNSVEFLELSEHIKLSSSCSGSAQAMDSLKDRAPELGSHPTERRGKGTVEEHKCNEDQKFQKKTHSNNTCERDTKCSLPKSLSAKAVMFNSPCKSEREISNASPRSRFSPFKKMLDPIMKSKSLRNPSIMETEIGGSTAAYPSSIKRHRVLRKSLLNDFSKATDKMNYDDILIELDQDQDPVAVPSPAHLHATLKLDCKHGALSYEFAVKDPDDIILAKTWRTDSAFNWAYTFHSGKKKGFNSSGQSSAMIGQMQVSCYLCSEINDNGSMESSTVTEFVLYDIAQARRSFAIEDSTSATTKSTEMETCQYRQLHSSTDFDPDPSTSYPWPPKELHSYLEIAATVIRIPFSKKEIKELQLQEDKNTKAQRNLPSSPAKDQGSVATFECMNHANVKVVAPSGPHSLPSNEEGSPSSLLDRWRYGGGCDCGGWDMACPIAVLDCPCAANDVVNHSSKGSHQQMVLFVQGRKDKIPALYIAADGKGQYSVDFHAQLSALQAFSICISILHSSEAMSALGQENKQMLYSNSLKLLLEEEVRHLLEAVADEEKRKTKKQTKQLQSHFILDPPFSPIGRV
ncbi:uncharacterized protein A4U43_C04F12220 [Asparagus officinalis]|uniref:Uncharacterized protein n=1 Tax=Asparagus officinalis TaxID=4686 RepID=A0A5P1F528_ASPOF|nr:uncharacterized protein LOC109837138 [Asparagus officinalis]XP_020260838.1 uncharacterized protein LOC109837138 [Asparagus officinalis]ONK71771.1 uncharacterized protein A4U43_C04F12220 [Asparagus officinalis]